MSGKAAGGRVGISVRDEERIVEAIRRAEALTSGEIRVRTESRCRGDALALARRRFVELGMHRTAERNGVLFFLALRARRFAVVGDEGIDREVGAAFWEALRDRLARRLREGDLVAGLEEAILATGQRLAREFPRRSDDRNELPDDLSRGRDADG